ncbi:MAG: NCS2 family permease [Spirochaetes bacterium]|nr:NCS2 family permease [Spirochaetota bacterium]
MKKFFQLEQNNTDVKTEVLAGITTFLTMAYILILNPIILSKAGMDAGALFTATALSSLIACLAMAFIANLPFALAPAMGLNGFFAFTVVLTMGYSWQFALTAVFIEGIIFLLLTFFNIREAIINCIPMNLKRAITVGIGLFIAFFGFRSAGLVVDDPATLVQFGNVGSPEAIVAIVGLIICGVLHHLKIKGAMLIGILAGTMLGIPLGVTNLENFKIISMPASIEPIFFKFEFDKILSLDMIFVLFAFLFVDLFDTVGTLVGVSIKAGMVDENGKLPKAKQALFADAIGTTVGAILGTSTVTTYAESTSGVEEGGRTGLTALTVGLLFAFALFFSPIFLMVPGAATAPVLIMVGLFMMSPIKEIDFSDCTEGLPVFMTFATMAFAFSIADGIAVGIITYAVMKLLTNRAKEVPVLSYVIAAIFILKYIVDIIMM